MPIRIFQPKISCLLSLLLVSPLVTAQNEPFFSIDGSLRLRHENLHNTYRFGSNGSDQLLTTQSLLSFKAGGKHLLGELEISDQRAWLDDLGTPLGTDDINTLEPLQAWIGWRSNSGFTAKAGRLSFDIGSRRLMARQRYRNTISAYDGVHVSYQQEDHQWQAFHVKPVSRLPTNRDELAHNETELDEQSDNRLWGIHYSQKGKTDLELYYYGLDEAGNGAEIATIGFRNLKRTAAEQWHYEVEAAYQAGENGNLDVEAMFAHLHLGYQFADALSSRVELIADYFSGDDDPGDDESNRFNSLGGVSRPDFGPTGIYGAFALTNTLSPGLKWSFRPRGNDTGFVTYRALWLASDTDTQSRSGLRDITGRSGSFAGHQIDARWQVNFSSQFQMELGATHLMKGEFLESTAGAPDTGDSTYIYSQVMYRFKH